MSKSSKSKSGSRSKQGKPRASSETRSTDSSEAGASGSVASRVGASGSERAASGSVGRGSGGSSGMSAAIAAANEALLNEEPGAMVGDPLSMPAELVGDVDMEDTSAILEELTLRGVNGGDNVVVAEEGEDSGDEVVVTEIRSTRPAAAAARIRIRDSVMEDFRVERQMRKRRAHVLEEQEENDDPVDEVCEIVRIVDREDREDGRFYRVRWADVEEGEEECDWVPEDGVAGAAELKKIADHYFDVVVKERPDMSYSMFLKSYRPVITMGANGDATCVYEALQKVTELLGGELVLRESVIQEFETKEGLDRAEQGGLTPEQVYRFCDFLVKCGWKCRVEKNFYVGNGAGIEALLEVATGPGIYFVGTVDTGRLGHCIALEVTDDNFCFVYEGGLQMGVGEFAGAHQIRWVRRCVLTEEDGSVVNADEAGGDWGERVNRRPLGRKPKRRKRVPRALRSRAGTAEGGGDSETAQGEPGV